MIAARVANALRARLPAELLEVIVACDGSHRRTAAAGARGGRRPVLDLPRGGKVRAQDAAVERARGEIARLLGRQRALGAGRAAAARGALRRPARRLRVRRSCASSRRAGDQPGGRSTGATRRAARAGVAAGVGHRRQRRDLRGAPRGLPASRSAHEPRPLVSVQHGQARLARRLRARGARPRAAGADDRGRVRAASGG